MRVNIEDDLYLSGRLSKLARTMRWSEREALGALVLVYRATQDAEVVEAPVDRIVSLVAVHFDDDEQARAFLDAMAASRLATGSLDGASFSIHGNDQHVARITRLRDQASAGGKARAKKSSADSLPAGSEMAPSRVPDRSAPSSLLLAPSPPSGVGIPLPPPTDSLREVTASQVPVEQAHALCEVYRDAMRDEHGSEQPLMPPPKRVHEAKLVIAMAGGDDALAARIVRAFVASPGNRGYWSDRKHAFHLLTDHRDFEHAQQLAAGGSAALDDGEDPIQAGLRRALESEAAAKRGAP